MAGTNYNAKLSANVKAVFTNDDGFIIRAECNGNPGVVATQSNTFVPGCIMLRSDFNMGVNLYQNTGTLSSPTWTAISGGGSSAFSSITGTPTEVAYFDALGNGTSDSQFTRNETTHEGNMDMDVFAVGKVNDGISQQVTFMADNPGAIGNSISLVFNGVDDTDTVIAAWNSANPTNTVSDSGGTGSFVPSAQTETLSGGGTVGYINSLDFFGQGFQLSGSYFSDGGSYAGFQGMFAADGSGIAPFILATDFVTGELSIGQFFPQEIQFRSDTNSGDAAYLKLVSNGEVNLIFDSVANGQAGVKADNSGNLQLLSNGNSWVWPIADGTNGQSIITNGSGVLSFGIPVVTASLTEHYIGFGDGSNLLTGDGQFQFNPTLGRFSVAATGNGSILKLEDDNRLFFGKVFSSLGEDYSLSIDGSSGHAQLEAFDGSSLYNYVGTSHITTYMRSQDGSNTAVFQTVATSATATATDGTSTMTMQVAPTLFQITGSVHSTALVVNDGSQVITVNKPFVLQGYTVATLPGGTVGMTAYVTDALAPTFGATVVGSGAVTTPVFYDGSNWVVR